MIKYLLFILTACCSLWAHGQNTSINFDGNTNYMSIPSSPGLMPNAMTIEALVYPTSIGAFQNIRAPFRHNV
jgi:hypothetical protein